MNVSADLERKRLIFFKFDKKHRVLVVCRHQFTLGVSLREREREDENEISRDKRF